MQNISFKNRDIKVINFESILEKTDLILYDDKSIEVPGLITFIKKGSSAFVNKLLNPSVEFIEIDQESFVLMTNTVVNYLDDSNYIFTKTKTMPEKNVIINLLKLKKSLIIYRESDDTIYINDYIFTNNEMEFIGSGAATTKKSYYISFDNLTKVKEAINNQ